MPLSPSLLMRIMSLHQLPVAVRILPGCTLLRPWWSANKGQLCREKFAVAGAYRRPGCAGLLHPGGLHEGGQALAPPPPDAAMPGGLAGAARGAKRILVMAGGAALVLLALYVMWPRVRGFGYGYDGVEETEHFVTVSGTQVRGAGAEQGQRAGARSSAAKEWDALKGAWHV